MMFSSSLRAAATLAKAISISVLAVLVSTAALGASAHTTLQQAGAPQVAAPLRRVATANDVTPEWPGGPCDHGAEARTC